MLIGSPDHSFFSTRVHSSSPGHFSSPMSKSLEQAIKNVKKNGLLRIRLLRELFLRKESAQSFRLVVISVHFVTVAGGVECGSVVNNSLSSPGYPGNYPNDMDCNYSVPILPGMATKITFHEFFVESSYRCR